MYRLLFLLNPCVMNISNERRCPFYTRYSLAIARFVSFDRFSLLVYVTNREKKD